MEYGVFEQLLTIIALSVVIIALFRRLSLPSILGYLAVGILIAIIDRYSFKDIASFNILAKYGVVFLLFTIGLEFSMTRLIALKRIVFLFGGLQVLICGFVFWIIAISIGLNALNAFIIAATLAMSSTALISKVLSESGEVQTHTGRMTIGVLIFQDIMVVPLLIITSIFANSDSSHLFQQIFIELILGCLTFIILYFIGRLVLTPFFREIARARSNELFVLAALMTALAAAYFTDAMGMSKELGAFLAGVILAGTPYHKQIANDIRPFRDVLLGLFFIGIGMSLNITSLPQTGIWIITFGVLIVLIKLIVIPIIPILLKISDRKQAFRTGLLLAQGGEFGFVLIAVATDFKFIQDKHAQIIIGSIIFSMILSLILIQLQKPLSYYIAKRKRKNIEITPGLQQGKSHVILCGFGYTGQQVARILKLSDTEYTAIDVDASCVSQAAQAGEPVFYGDACNRNILLSLGLKYASSVVVCFNDEQSAKDISEIVEEETSRIPLIIRVKMKQGLDIPTSSSATIIDEGIEIGLILGKQVLSSLNLTRENISKVTDQFKQHAQYEFFHGSEIYDDEDVAEKPQLYSFQIIDDAIACNKSLQDLKIKFDKLNLINIHSNKNESLPFTEESILNAGDILIISGDLDEIASFEASINK